jgi:hypothetical protein
VPIFNGFNRIHWTIPVFALEILVQIDHRQLEAAHQLGEAILRFIKVTETSKKVDESAEPSKKVPHQVENRLLRVDEAAQILSLGK